MFETSHCRSYPKSLASESSRFNEQNETLIQNDATVFWKTNYAHTCLMSINFSLKNLTAGLPRELPETVTKNARDR